MHRSEFFMRTERKIVRTYAVRIVIYFTVSIIKTCYRLSCRTLFQSCGFCKKKIQYNFLWSQHSQRQFLLSSRQSVQTWGYKLCISVYVYKQRLSALCIFVFILCFSFFPSKGSLKLVIKIRYCMDSHSLAGQPPK